MKNKVALKAGGPAGSGVFTIGVMFARTMQKMGLYVFYTSDYPSLIKGGHNTCYIRAEDEPVNSHIGTFDVLVALDKQTVEKHFNDLSGNGAVIYDSRSTDIASMDMSSRKDLLLFGIPFSKLGRELGDKIYGNIIALGAVAALLDMDMEKVYLTLENQFEAKKGTEVAESNKKAAKKGYDFFKENFKDINFKVKIENIKSEKTILLSGNDAASIGAIKAGVKFVAEYPMTPSSGILHFMAANEQKYNIVVKHTEDEIAAVNMLCGASMTGVRCMTGTSGGGFALMTEGLGMAGLSESPIVIVESQRTGPSTGMPTYTEQSDLRFALHASQGEFPRLICAPGDVEESFYEMFKMFNLVERVQTPGIFLMDKHLSASSMTIKPYDTSKLKVERGKLMSNKDMEKAKDFKRYEITEDGISPRSVPGQPNGLYVSTSYEHDETGWTSEESDMRIAQVEKRERKMLAIKEEEIAPKLYGDEDADLTLVSWGSNKGMILEAMKFLKNEGFKVNFLHVLWIWPFPTKKVTEILSKAKKTLMIEQNMTAQLRGIIREVTGIYIKDTLLKYDGRPFDPEEIYFRAKEVLK